MSASPDTAFLSRCWRTLVTPPTSRSKALSCVLAMSAGGAICSYWGGMALAAARRAASVWDSLGKWIGRGARISVCATCPTSSATWPGTTLRVRIAVRAAASRTVTMTARAKGPRPRRRSPPASVRGMNMDRWRLAAAAPREQPPDQLAERPTVCTALDLGHQPAHDATHVRRRRGAGLSDGSACEALELSLIELLGKELGEDGDLPLLIGRAVLAAGAAIDLDALAPLLDLPAEHLAHLVICQVTTQLDAPVVGSGHCHSQRLRASLVARSHGVTHGVFDPMQQCHGLDPVWSGGRHRSDGCLRGLKACVWRYRRVALRFLASLRLRFTLGFS